MQFIEVWWKRSGCCLKVVRSDIQPSDYFTGSFSDVDILQKTSSLSSWQSSRPSQRRSFSTHKPVVHRKWPSGHAGEKEVTVSVATCVLIQKNKTVSNKCHTFQVCEMYMNDYDLKAALLCSHVGWCWSRCTWCWKAARSFGSCSETPPPRFSQECGRRSRDSRSGRSICRMMPANQKPRGYQFDLTHCHCYILTQCTNTHMTSLTFHQPCSQGVRSLTDRT